MRESEAPDDLPDRVVRVLDGVDGSASPGRVQRLLARDGIDVAGSVVRETCDALAEEGRLEKDLGPKYTLPED